MRTFLAFLMFAVVTAPICIFILVAMATPPKGVRKIDNLFVAGMLIVISLPIAYFIMRLHNSTGW